MLENIENKVNISAKSFNDICHTVQKLRHENKQLKKDNQNLSDELNYFKSLCETLEEENIKIKFGFDKQPAKIGGL